MRINPLIYGPESESAIQNQEGYGLRIRTDDFFKTSSSFVWCFVSLIEWQSRTSEPLFFDNTFIEFKLVADITESFFCQNYEGSQRISQKIGKQPLTKSLITPLNDNDFFALAISFPSLIKSTKQSCLRSPVKSINPKLRISSYFYICTEDGLFSLIFKGKNSTCPARLELPRGPGLKKK